MTVGKKNCLLFHVCVSMSCFQRAVLGKAVENPFYVHSYNISSQLKFREFLQVILRQLGNVYSEQTYLKFYCRFIMLVW